jgi:uncharacterized repeat protein (TIGR03837 family)
MKTDQLRCDIFCAVIDNLGDAGVCWRLARQLAVEHGWRVRLWIDAPAPLDLLAPERDDVPVEIRKWEGDFAGVAPGQVVVEAFACELPPAYLAAMAALPRPPVWLNLEYLSAEDWVAGCHGLPSPHPRLPLIKHFFFPGFAPGTGGLLRERDFTVPPAPSFAETLTVSLFCYENPALPDLLACWRDSAEDIVCRVAAGLPQAQVAAWLGTDFAAGNRAERGRLALVALPFVPQRDYDAVLAGCQLNFVRGEDSLVRAQWAERPFVWQAYPQTEDSHHAKLDALLDLYCAGRAEFAPLRDFWRAWNSDGDVAAAWPVFRAALPAIATAAPTWSARIAAHGDLATNLANFCTARL